MRFLISLLISSLLLSSVFAEEAKKDPLTVEMIEGPTTRPHTLITPLSSDKNSLEDAYADMRKKAAKMGADAVIEYVCDKGLKARGGGVFGIANKETIKAGCAGKAVKWTGSASAAVSQEVSTDTVKPTKPAK